MKEKEDKNNHSMIAKALELMELLSRFPAGMSLQEMHVVLNYPKSSIHKIITILFEAGYLHKESDSFRYYLSRKLLQVGLSAINGYNLIERSAAYMKDLRDKVGESVMIGTLVDREVVLLNQIQGNLDFVFVLKPGMKFNLHSTAPGKVLLAFLPEKEQAGILNELELAPINNFTITSKEDLKVELTGITNRGYAVDLNETVEGVHCLAAPVFDESGRVIACLWVSGPSGRLLKKDISQTGRYVREYAHAISLEIGYTSVK